jgi:hypothetical protein
MKKRIIALSVAAALGAFAGAASAQTAAYLSPNLDGVGHILYNRYFTTQGKNATLMNIVNTDTVNAKAVKVRFRGASNSDDIFDFQVFLSPGDMWTAMVSKSSTGVSQLSTSDKSCTLPASVNQEFITTRLNPSLTGDALAAETREGYVEILNMADIPPGSALFTTVKHVNGVAPCKYDVLSAVTPASPELTLPTTGLFGNWIIIDVPNTTTFSGDMMALEGRQNIVGTPAYSALPPGTGNKVFSRQASTSLSSIPTVTADPLFLKGVVVPAQYDAPDLSTPYVTSAGVDPQSQANYLSQALAARVMGLEYLSDPAIKGGTDWVISMPTRRYYVAVDYKSTPVLISNATDNGKPNAYYFREDATPTGEPANVVLGGVCKAWQIGVPSAGIEFRDREEGAATSDDITISPGNPKQPLTLCGEVSVLGINGSDAPSYALSASNTYKVINTGLTNRDGWGFFRMDNPVTLTSGTPPVTALRYLGIPMVGQQFTKAVNGNVGTGISGNYGANWSGRILQRGDFYTE